MDTIYKLKTPIAFTDRFTLDQLREKFLEPVVHQEYPKMVYHGENKPFAVNSKEEEEKAVNDGYSLEPVDNSSEEVTADTNEPGEAPEVVLTEDQPENVIPEPTQYEADKTADEINADAS